MGFGRGILLPQWAFLLAVCCVHQIGGQIEFQTGSQFSGGLLQQQNASIRIPGTLNIIPPLLTNLAITSANPAHNGRVCSTWGNFHFKTFDGDIFTFPGLCNYVFASHCNAPYEDFNIQIRREVVANTPTINRITMKLEGVVAELTEDAVLVDGNRVELPYSQSGITIEKSSIYVKVGSKIGVVLLWNEKDSILLELNEKYANQTCGLCGDFNGFPIYNEFISNNVKMTALQFGNMQKMDGPTEHCEDSTSIPTYNCSDNLDDICEKILTSSAFAECNDLVDVQDYIEVCQDDLCRSAESKNSSCICDTFAEYSRQCAHAGGQPLDWRTSKLCPKKCPYNMQYQECNSPCADTCTNPGRSLFCEEHCIDGCFCPPGTVFDDINNSGCIPQQECSCIYNGKTYATGASFSDPCQTCTCNGGQWSCQDKSCPGTCSVVGGSHISTYDMKYYDHHGDCTYVLSKDCNDEKFTILAELRKCGLTDTETCLKSVTLNMNKGQTIVDVKPDGGVFVNSIYTQLPMSAASVTMFRPSSFFMIMDTSFGVQVEVQFTPMMQVFVRLDASFKNQTCGLCGNFNNIQTDDFKVISGIIEGTASAFANTWKTQASCPNIQQSFENPCALSIDNEKYAQHWCGLLTDSTGPFAACHYAVNPTVYHTNCMFDTCNCENSEDCLCAALSAYVRACAAKGIQLQGWRTDVCTKYTTSCPKSLSYSYTISSCQPTCRSLSEPDVTCNIKFVPVDGCTCVNGTYMDESGKCVPANECPCYSKGSPIPFGEVVHENGRVCTCVQGRLNCIGAPNPTSVCESPMVYFDCTNNTAGTTGAECQKSCQTLDMQCYSSQCTSGCICPDGLVLDGNGGCIPEEECPCIHNEAMYQPGEMINFDCNTCVCKNRKWECTKDQCLGTCAVYGDGHYNTFDDKRFSFNGNCEYTLVQDHCGTVNGTFRVATENVPCGNTGTTCSKSIKVFLESYELILGEEHVSVVKRGQSDEVPYTVRSMGMYLVIETKSGLILMWDKKTSIFIKLSPGFKGQVCGLCGNYDGNSINDFTTRSQSVVENVLEFGNSWKVSSTCPDAASVKDPCSTNPYRKSWSEKQCSIINSNVFAACHSQVEPAKYYQACVTDACACDTGGDCDCFCTAVAAYAQACSEVGVCVAWRSPAICPLFCDYYNQQGECEWHYKPCGASCMKTCKNPSGKCLNNLPGLEGCYPNCPPDKPYFHEDQMKCVSLCDCYDDEDGKIYKRDECNICECTSEGLQCQFDDKACNCIYEGNSYKYGEVIYNTTDGTGWCFSATCDVNGTISRNIFKCGIFTTTPFTFSTSQPTTTASEMTTATPVTTVCVKNVCVWTEWYDSTQPENKEDSGDYETYQNLKDKGYSVCTNPIDVQCRAKEYPDTEITNLNQTIECSQRRGLICNNQDQESKQCYNYEIRISCCRYIPCSEAQTTTPTTTREFTTTALESTPFTVQTTIIPTTQIHRSQVATTPPRVQETILTETPVTATTSHVSTTGYQITTTTAETSTAVTQAPSSPNTISILPESTLKTTLGTTIISRTTALQSMAVMTPRVTTQVTTNASTSMSTAGSTTRASSTSAPGETSTVTTQASTSLTTPSDVIVRTTTGTTASPSTKTSGRARAGTTPIATTTSTTPPPTEVITTTTPPTTTEPTPATTTIHTSNTTDNCVVEQCAWTQWFNVDSPTSGSENGDLETFDNIRAAGYELCDKPKDIKCQAKDYPDSIVKAMEQKFDCSLDRGLVCKNEDQTPKYPTCFDYEVSVLCCALKPCRTTVPPPGTTVRTSTEYFTTETTTTEIQPTATSTAGPTPSQGITTTTVGTSTLSTQGTTTVTSGYPQPIIETTTGTTAGPSTTASTREGTSPIATTTRTSPPQTESTTTTIPPTKTVPTPSTSTASTSMTTAGSTTRASSTSAPGETSTVTTQASTSLTTPSDVIVRTTTGTTASPSTKTSGRARAGTTPIATTTRTSPSPTEVITTTTPPTTTEPTPATTTIHTSNTTDNCVVEQCAWTQWFNVDSPTSGSENGDLETFDNIRAAGYELCDKPKDIKCQAKDYPDSIVKIMGQKFNCSRERGLVCKNEDQTPKYPICFDYEVSVLCCALKPCRTTVPPPGTTVRTSTEYFTTETTTTEIQPTATSTAGPTPSQGITTTTVGTSTLSTQGTTTVTSGYPQPIIETTTGTTAGPSTTASTREGTSPIATTTRTSPPQTESTTTIIPPTKTVRTPATSTASTSMTTAGSTTRASSTSAPGETSTVTTQASTSLTTPSDVIVRTTTGTTASPSTTTSGRARVGTTPIATTTRTSPPQTEGTTTIIPPTKTVRTPATSTASTSVTTAGSTTRASSTSAPGETSTVTTQASTSLTTPSDVIVRTTTGTTAGPSTKTSGRARAGTTPIATTTSTTPPPTEVITTTTPPTTTEPTPATTTIHTSNTTDNCVVEQCAWTQWFNVDSPTSGSENGDLETFDNIRAAGYELCDKPKDIKCQAKDYPDSIVKAMEQKFDCSLDRGLVCKNEDQTPKYPTCFDYEVSVLCCALKPCRTTVPPPGTTVRTSTEYFTTETTTTEIQPTATSTAGPTPSQGITTTTVGTSTLSTQGTTTVTSGYPQPIIETTTGTTAGPSTTASTREGTSPIATTTRTSPPQTESTTTIFPPTKTVPTPSTSTASTSVTTAGSTTRASSTSAPGETSTVTTQASTSLTTPSDVIVRTTTGTTASPSTTTSGSARVGTTPIATTTRTSPPQTEGTTTIIPPTKTVRTPATSTASTSVTTAGSTTRASSTSAPGETSTVTTQASTSLTTPSDVIVRTTTGTTAGPSTKTSGRARAGTTPIATTTSTTPPPTEVITTTTPPTTTEPTPATTTIHTSNTTDNCVVEQCAWTQWFNVDSPTSGSENGDLETFDNIRAAGYELCDKPKDIKCQAKDYPDSIVKAMEQKFDCSLDRGLVCKNEDQTPKYPTCFDYEVSVLCCALKPCRTTVPPPGTTVRTSTEYFTTEKTTTEIQPTATSTAGPTPSQGITTTTVGTSTLSTQGTTTVTSGYPQPIIETTTGTTAGPSTTASTREGTSPIATTTRTSPPQTESTTTIIPPTKTVPTPSTSTASSSMTTAGSTTRASSTSAPGETSTVTTQASTSLTTPSDVIVRTTTGTTAGPSTTTSAREGITPITTTTSTASTSPEITTSGPSVMLTTTLPQSGSTTVASTGTSQSSHATTSTPETFSSSTSTSVTSTKIPPCFCHVFETLFSPGEVVYNRTDRAGCNFYALCSKECEIKPFYGPCQPPVPSVASSTTSQASSPTTATTTTTSVAGNCSDVIPARKPGEEWINECQKCVCDSLTATVQCQPLPCPTAQQTICDLGFVSMAVLPQKDPCCHEFECQPIPDVCVINGTLYTVGKSVVIDSCKKCTCSSEKDPETNANIMHCETFPCETSCPLAYQYMAEEGQCCGRCVQIACTVKHSNGTVHVLNVNETLPFDQCSHYKCEKIEDQFVAVESKRVCPDYDPGECNPDEAEITSDGCCKICKPKNCKPYTKETVIRHADCESSEPVELSYCEGTCPSSSMYSLEANQMEHKCGCCQELGTQTREVTLTCQNGTSINYTYLYVENCQCVNACSSETTAAPDSQFQQSRKYGSQLQQAVSLGSQWQLS
ncbi:mucin-5AC [Taeniopygia guttata]|uniref:mucin-5AC n=1 Tax=Taeniopygia guttata TaxID=59729 RepID=UPI003BB883C5